MLLPRMHTQVGLSLSAQIGGEFADIGRAGLETHPGLASSQTLVMRLLIDVLGSGSLSAVPTLSPYFFFWKGSMCSSLESGMR